METRICKRKECNNLIATSKRSDSLYCTPKCGAKDRNDKNRRLNKEKIQHQKKLNKNYKIIKDLYYKGRVDVSKEVLDALEFDEHYNTGMEELNMDRISFNLYEFKISFKDDRFYISKSDK